jgi:hypothetical protein
LHPSPTSTASKEDRRRSREDVGSSGHGYTFRGRATDIFWSRGDCESEVAPPRVRLLRMLLRLDSIVRACLPQDPPQALTYTRSVPVTVDHLRGLDVLLNESVLLDAELDRATRTLALTFYVEMVPENGDRSLDDLYVQLVLCDVRRLAVLYRRSDDWDDLDAACEPLHAESVGEVLRSIRNHDAVYGWRFFDVPEEDAFTETAKCLSVDHRFSDSYDHAHTLTVWNEELVERDERGRKMIELRVWFEDLMLRGRDGSPIVLDDAIAAGKRYWEQVLTRGSGGPSPYPVPRVVITVAH